MCKILSIYKSILLETALDVRCDLFQVEYTKSRPKNL